MESGGAFLSAELLIKLRAAGRTVVEVGVPHYPRTAGSPTGAKPQVIVRAVRDFWRLRLRMWVNRARAARGERSSATDRRPMRGAGVGLRRVPRSRGRGPSRVPASAIERVDEVAEHVEPRVRRRPRRSTRGVLRSTPRHRPRSPASPPSAAWARTASAA